MVEKEFIAKFKGNKIFIETGTQTGAGVEAALFSGFEEIHSIEIREDFYNIALKNFKDNPKVHLYFGDSREVLPKILEKIKEPATFWLDGHSQHDSPILEELDILKKHPIKNHTILIDDCGNFDRNMGKIGFFVIAKNTQQINLNYKLQLDTANDAYPQAVLVAKEQW